VHSAFAANGYPTDFSIRSIWLIILESISIIGVNVFIFISGYFSIKLKFQTIKTLFITVAFYFFFHTGLSLIIGAPIQIRNLLFFSNSHYFIVDYLGLALLSPILNKFIDVSGKKEVLVVLLSLIIYEIYFGYFTGAAGSEFDLGYSLLSFSILYLIARYIRLYDVPIILTKYSGVLYWGCVIALILESIIGIALGYPRLLERVYAYNNPIVILSAMCFFLYFRKLNIHNSNFINHIAKSTLGVLLFHAAIPAYPVIWEYMKQIFISFANEISPINVFLWGVIILAIFFVAVAVDQFRLYIINCLSFKNKK